MTKYLDAIAKSNILFYKKKVKLIQLIKTQNKIEQNKIVNKKK